MIASSPRHEMEVHIRMGADENGIVKAIDLYTLSNTAPMENMDPQRSDFPDINLLRCTVTQKRTVLLMMWFIPICRRQALTVAMVPHRVFLPWSLRLMSWLIRWVWTR